MRYVHSLPPLPSFEGKGLFGYTFGPLQEKDLEIYYIESDKGHDTFTVSRRATRVYYVIDGSGYFTISDHRHDVSRGSLGRDSSKSGIFLYRKNETYSRFQATFF